MKNNNYYVSNWDLTITEENYDDYLRMPANTTFEQWQQKQLEEFENQNTVEEIDTDELPF